MSSVEKRLCGLYKHLQRDATSVVIALWTEERHLQIAIWSNLSLLFGAFTGILWLNPEVGEQHYMCFFKLNYSSKVIIVFTKIIYILYAVNSIIKIIFSCIMSDITLS